MTMTETLKANDPIVKKLIEENKIEPVEHGKPAYEVGGRNMMPETQNVYPLELPTKPFEVRLTAQQEARCIREAASRRISVLDYLQEILNERLTERIGKAPVTGPSSMGPRVTAPSNYYGRETN